MYTTPMCKTCGQRGPHKCFGLIPAFPSNSKKQPLVIQISGKKRSGKDTIAKFLLNAYKDQGKSVELMSYAEPLKDIAATILNITPTQLETFKNEPELYKLVTINKDTFVTVTNYRSVLQLLGSETMKKWFGPNVWVELLKHRINQSQAYVIIIPDWRFKSEIIQDSIKLRVLTHIKSTDTHISEIDLDNYTDFNHYIDNIDYKLTQQIVTNLVNSNFKDSNVNPQTN